ncbi:hypothetical protein M407DRAFT_241003 [Tulasnella calospora MUT 4182]|uniref:Uncharacterized protein n=1 Tax=Tulasnella calospora MUT 4182 TaxID=1051891 RepID=A0A0C3LI10_9AGAM|nr:hypothetical protein M407DRAFT_241003 [Tulasnella calospora MUT 4182]
MAYYLLTDTKDTIVCEAIDEARINMQQGGNELGSGGRFMRKDRGSSANKGIHSSYYSSPGTLSSEYTTQQATSHMKVFEPGTKSGLLNISHKNSMTP